MSQAALEEEIWRGGAPVELVLAESDRISSLTVEPVYVRHMGFGGKGSVMCCVPFHRHSFRG